MSKRFIYSLAVSIMLPLALAALVWAFANNRTPAMLDAKVKPFVPQGVWADVVAFPTVTLGFSGNEPTTGPLYLKRAAAVGYPPNGKVYILGGRHRPDGTDIGSRWIWEYNPANNTLTQKSALLDLDFFGNRFTGNMVAAVLTDTTGTHIYLVGGSSVDTIPSTAVRMYDPTTDSVNNSYDTWPANPARIPGGSAVYNNKLYIFGGHVGKPTTQLFSDTWVFDPMMPAGSRWTQIPSANLSVPRAYIAGAQLDGYIYAIGGDQVISNTATPLSIVERMDPSQGSPTWQPVASLPYGKGDMSAWAYNTGTGYEISGRIVVAGGGYPVPDTASFAYDPGSNSWSVFPDMLRPRRNYAAAQLNGFLYAWGGYDVQGNTYNGSNTNMSYDASGPPTTPGPPPTNTPTPLPTTCAATSNYSYTVSTGATIDPGTTLAPGSSCQTCAVNVTLPFPVTIYGSTFTKALVSTAGNIQFGSDSPFWINRPLPWEPYRYTLFPFWDDMATTGSGHGIYTSVSGSAPNRVFNVEWRTTLYDFEVRFFENSTGFEYVYGTGTGGTGTIGVQENMSYYTQAGYNVAKPASGTRYSWSAIPCGGTPTPTPTGSPPTATRTSTPANTIPPTNTPSPTATTCSNYNITTSTGATIVPGTTMLPGSNCDDCVNSLALPFPFRLYDQTFSSVNVSSNGNMQFTTSDNGFTNSCLPYPPFGYAILPQWDDLLLTCGQCGVFYSTSGTAPNRIFNVQWVGTYFTAGGLVNMEARLYENSPTQQIDFIYQLTDSGTAGTVGVQGGGQYAQFECGTGGLSAGLKISFNLPSCSTPTTGPSATATNTPVGPSVTPPLPSATRTTAPGITPSATDTTGPSATPGTASPTATICNIEFIDVPPGSTFYQYIHCLACHGIVNGYPDGTFRWNNPVTRGQLSKIISNSAGFSDPAGAQLFEDVLPGSTFYDYIQRLASRGYISGYPCGGPGEPCVAPGNLPYFRPFSNASRGQLAKIASNAAGFQDPIPPGEQSFEDVAPGSTFYDFIQRLANRGYIGGYPCGSPGEPCVPPGNRPYFRPNATVTRGQTSKIAANVFMSDCDLP